MWSPDTPWLVLAALDLQTAKPTNSSRIKVY
uniref:Uncharacterized protein n=1 Tax=Nelumbo nucifera TaxID=4432 RepID=A0A822ZK45_NELNU|nr:TPA_asm: hypothetical protein HUJ06_000338 [Nelumbo nucifera]